MNWSYTKVIIIILLALLNIGMLGIRLNNDRAKYSLSSEVEDNIRHILKVYDYQLYTFLPSEFYPMKTAKENLRTVDNGSIANHFFGKGGYQSTKEGNKETYYRDEDTYVEVYRNGKINYYEKIKDNEVLLDGVIDKDEAYDLVTKFLLKVYKGDRIYKAASYDKENNIYMFPITALKP